MSPSEKNTKLFLNSKWNSTNQYTDKTVKIKILKYVNWDRCLTQSIKQSNPRWVMALLFCQGRQNVFDDEPSFHRNIIGRKESHNQLEVRP